MADEELQPWTTLSSEAGPDLRIFSTRVDLVENPRNGHRMNAFVLDTPDWVNVVALTEAGNVVMVEQHRFGTGSVSLEVAGGIVDPGEAHADTARRELSEETGYVADGWRHLGSVSANPAFMNNRCHFWLATGARPERTQELDAGEDIAVSEMTPDELFTAIAGGRVHNSLTLLALARVFDLTAVDLGGADLAGSAEG